MKQGICLAALFVIFPVSFSFSQTNGLAVTEGPPSNGSPAWYIQKSAPDPLGRTSVSANGTVTILPMARISNEAQLCRADIDQYCGGKTGFDARLCLAQNLPKLTNQCRQAANLTTPPCNHSTICGRRDGISRSSLERVEWKQQLGYTFSYPYDVPGGPGGIPAAAIDSKGNLWAFKRSPAGVPQLYEFDEGHKLVRSIGEEVIGRQEKAHGMAIDANDNVWICDADGATVMEISSDGRLLRTFGLKDHRGDWNEASGQRLLWQPVMVAFGPTGDIYIAEGHANESPNDVDSGDPENQIGASRIIHLDKTGNFINQWFGDEVGQGKFDSAHGLAIDPSNGDVWIGDREQYRIVIYTAEGKFVRTLQERNLVCALNFDSKGNPWMATGQDGQFLKLDRIGRVLGAIGNGMGIGLGQFTEASYWSFDKHDNLYAGDTSVGRVTVMRSPKVH